MTEKFKVVLTDYVWESIEIEKNILGKVADIVALQVNDTNSFFPESENCDALLNTYAGPITEEVMLKMPNCKIISRYGIGVDTIDLKAATKAGIIVTNNPTYCIEEVAEHTIAMLLSSARKISFYDRTVRNGKWAVPPGKPIYRIAGSTLGLIGYGNIARRVATAAKGLEMKVIYSDPFVEEGQFETPGKKVEMSELLANSDFICIHAPLIDQTRYMINENAFSQMKNSAIVINCSRGPIIHTEDLINALDNNKIAGCALDTTDPEPLPEKHALRNRENVIINPHAAWYSEQAMVRLQEGAPNEVLMALTGKWPNNVVNKEVKNNNRAGI